MRQFHSIIILFIFITSNLSSLFATAQIPDILIYKGDTLSLFANPLEQLYGNDSTRPNYFGEKEACVTTACWRAYRAEWEIIDNQLYLIGIYSCCYYNDSIKADLKVLFGEKCQNGKVKANWFTGTIIAPKGKQIYYVHMGYESLYEQELEFKVKNGLVSNARIYDNSKSKLSIYRKDEKKLKDFIYSNIKWDNLASFEGKEIRVVAQFSANKKGNVDKVKIIRKADPVLEKEVIRVIKLIPEWDVFYKHGKHIRVNWNYSIIFSEENRQKYNSTKQN